PRDCTVRVASTALTSSMSIGLMPITDGIRASIAAESPGLPKLSLYSDQPMMPSSVAILRKEKVRQPASHLKTSNVLTFMLPPRFDTHSSHPEELVNLSPSSPPLGGEELD